VVGVLLGFVGVVALDARPEDGRASLGRDGDVEPREAGLAAALHVAQVHKEGVEPRPPGGEPGRILVVVLPVELARLIPGDETDTVGGLRVE